MVNVHGSVAGKSERSAGKTQLKSLAGPRESKNVKTEAGESSKIRIVGQKRGGKQRHFRSMLFGATVFHLLSRFTARAEIAATACGTLCVCVYV